MCAKRRRSKERLPELPAVLTVAVIDDDESVRLLLHTFLEGLGHEVLEFTTAKDFIEQWEAEEIEPHLIFLDHMMPGTTGLELSRRLDDTMLPIVMVTATTDPAILEQMAAVSSWVLNYIAKPVSQEDITRHLAFIRGQIRRQRADEEVKRALQHRLEDIITIIRALGALCKRHKKKEWTTKTAYDFLSARSNNTGIKIPVLAQQTLATASDDELESGEDLVRLLAPHLPDKDTENSQDEQVS